MPTLELISLIANFILGSGVITLFIFYRSKRRTAAAEATSAELSNYDKLIAKYELYIDTLTVEQTSLKQDVRTARQEAQEARASEAKERDKVVGLYVELNDVRVREQKALGATALAEYDKCVVPRCKTRLPKREEINEKPN